MINQILASLVFSAPSGARRIAAAAVGSLALASFACATGCASDAAPPEAAVDKTDQGWDSQGGNPTHATHSYLTEFAVDQLSGWYPELATYRSFIVDGANQELHELPLTDPEEESLRKEADGTNWACNHPEAIWNHARASYAAGDKQKAYWYVGIILHWVEDMGVPAHAFHVYHQGTLGSQDNFELLGLQRWAPKFDALRTDPAYGAPSDYVLWSGSWTRSDFQSAFPGSTYSLHFFPMSWLWASSDKSRFVSEREGRTAIAAKYALRAAALGLPAH